jgi:SAM-dependent methyltransferase
LDSEHKPDRVASEAAFQDLRMARALSGEAEFRDKFYFINRNALNHYERLHDELRGKRVVVVGSSDGGVTPLARRGVYVEGTDISPVSIEKLQKAIEREGLGKYASARIMNAEDLQYPNASIDVITCSGVLHHVDTERALRSWARCLKPDGAVLMFEPLALHPVAALFRAVTPKMRTPDEHPLRSRDFRIMRQYFEVLERTDYGLTTPICAAFAIIPGMRWLAATLLPAFQWIDSSLLRTLPFLRNLCWLTVIRLSRPKTA